MRDVYHGYLLKIKGNHIETAVVVVNCATVVPLMNEGFSVNFDLTERFILLHDQGPLDFYRTLENMSAISGSILSIRAEVDAPIRIARQGFLILSMVSSHFDWSF